MIKKEDLKGKFIVIRSLKQGEEVQKKLFSMGINWGSTEIKAYGFDKGQTMYAEYGVDDDYSLGYVTTPGWYKKTRKNQELQASELLGSSNKILEIKKRLIK